MYIGGQRAYFLDFTRRNPGTSVVLDEHFDAAEHTVHLLKRLSGFPAVALQVCQPRPCRSTHVCQCLVKQVRRQQGLSCRLRQTDMAKVPPGTSDRWMLRSPATGEVKNIVPKRA